MPWHPAWARTTCPPYRAGLRQQVAEVVVDVGGDAVDRIGDHGQAVGGVVGGGGGRVAAVVVLDGLRVSSPLTP